MIMEDYMIRCTAGDGSIRFFAATTRNTVETARTKHNTSPVVTAALGRTLTAGVMMGNMLKGEDDLLTISLRGDGPMAGITVTADASGNVKGYAQNAQVILPANSVGKLDVAGAIGKGYLTVIKDLGLKDPYVGKVDLISGEIAEDLTYYFAASEQVPSSVGLGVLMNRDNTTRAAGGFIIQLMPGADDALIDALEAKLSSIPSVTTMLDSGMLPEDIMQTILSDYAPEVLEKKPVGFACNCSKERVEKVIISLGSEEITSLINEKHPAEVNCVFCGKQYVFSVDDLCALRKTLRK